MWQYSQSTGALTAPDGSLAGSGYSGGHGEGVNAPQMQNVADVGPIPQGFWAIGAPYTDPEKGPLVMRLEPDSATETFGRSGFLIHGDLVGHVGAKLASHGCIILSHALRQAIATSEDSNLLVNP